MSIIGGGTGANAVPGGRIIRGVPFASVSSSIISIISCGPSSSESSGSSSMFEIGMSSLLWSSGQYS
jgi:hypothetical protein